VLLIINNKKKEITMKNKLLLTTALAGLALSTSAFAETKITGGMTLTYAGISSASSSASSTQGMGREVQLDIRNSGDLNNGWKYAAGFSMEQDGTQTGFDGGEQNFIDFIKGDTTLSFGMDHMPNLSGTAVPRVGKMLGTATAGINARPEASSQSLIYLNDPLSTTYTSFGVGIMQKVPTGVVSFNFIPRVGDTGSVDAGGGDGSEGNRAYEATYNGQVDAIGIKLGYKNIASDHNLSTVTNGSGKAYQGGVNYTAGAFKIGANRNVVRPGTTNTDYNTNELGVAYAINNNLSVSASRASSKKDGGATNETITEAAIGYNLGAVSVVLQYADVQDANGVANKDGEKLALRLSTAF
jgi:hypothetical protein